MANLIKAITTGVGGISTTADASGAITFQKDSTTTATIDASGNLGVTGNISTPTGTVTASSFVGNGSGLTGLASAQIQTQVFTAPGTWTNPGSVTRVRVTVVGGGGGGGGGPGTTSGGDGGGGGIAIASFSIPTSPVAITVGSGGAGGYPAGSGVSGGSSSFGPYVSATGGAGGGPSGANGAPGTGTVSAPISPGTIKTFNVPSTLSATTQAAMYLFFGQIGRASAPGGANAPALTYSTTSTTTAGAFGNGGGIPGGAGGTSGAVLVEFVG